MTPSTLLVAPAMTSHTLVGINGGRGSRPILRIMFLRF